MEVRESCRTERATLFLLPPEVTGWKEPSLPSRYNTAYQFQGSLCLCQAFALWVTQKSFCASVTLRHLGKQIHAGQLRKGENIL